MSDREARRIALPCIWLATVYGAVLMASFIAPYDPTEQRRHVPWMSATPIHFFRGGHFQMKPYVCRILPPAKFSAVYVEDCQHKFPIRWFIERRLGSDSSEATWHLFGVDEPAGVHLLGTDQYGRDQFSRFLHGGRLSLFAGLFACTIAMSLGIIAGAVSGFYGGGVDGILMWTSEIFLSLPWLFLLFGFRAFLPLNLEPTTSFLTIVAVIGIVGWARPARLIRNAVLSVKEREYVLAARGLGATSMYLVRRHILPATTGIILTQTALLIPRYILAEITLSFFGLGVNEPQPSWGQMLASLTQYYMVAPHSAWMYAPIVSLVLTCYSYLILAERLRVRFGGY